MSARRHLNPDQFSKINFEHEESSGEHFIHAYHPDFGEGKVPIGGMTWAKQPGKKGTETYDTGEIHNIYVDPQYQRNGIATRMFETAQNYQPGAKHSLNKTRQGRLWANKIGGPSV